MLHGRAYMYVHYYQNEYSKRQLEQLYKFDPKIQEIKVLLLLDNATSHSNL